MHSADPNRPIPDIVEDIRVSAGVVNNIGNRGLVLMPFVALLVKLNRDSAEAINKNIEAQKETVRSIDQLASLLDRLGKEATETADGILPVAKEYMNNPESTAKAKESSKQQPPTQPIEK
jgi:hypothetical protein